MATAETTKHEKAPASGSEKDKADDVAKLEAQIADLEKQLEEARAKLRRALAPDYPKMVFSAKQPDVPVDPPPPPEVQSKVVAGPDEEAEAKKEGFTYASQADAQAAATKGSK